jgi:hypothetical protein
MDNWSSAGAKHSQQLNLEPRYLKPMEDVAFQRLEPGPEEDHQIEDIIHLRESSLWAQMIPLTEMIAQIEELHETTVRKLSKNIDIYTKATRLAHRLDSWLLRLPTELRNSPENFERFTDLGHGRTFVWLHVNYHHHSTLLYYQFLHQDPDNSPDPLLTYEYANRCKEHAKELSSLLWTTNSTTNCDCIWVGIGHLLVVSSSVHLHTLLFAVDEQLIGEAKQLLKQNFEMMIRLQKYWPALELSLSRLRAFLDACRRNMGTSFRMDSWMLQFLQRYTRPCGWKCTKPLDEDPIDWPSPAGSQDYNYGLATSSEILNIFVI